MKKPASSIICFVLYELNMDKIRTINADLFKLALMIRRTEDKFLELFDQGKMNGTVHTCNGQEFSEIAFSSAHSQ